MAAIGTLTRYITKEIVQKGLKSGSQNIRILFAVSSRFLFWPITRQQKCGVRGHEVERGPRSLEVPILGSGC